MKKTLLIALLILGFGFQASAFDYDPDYTTKEVRDLPIIAEYLQGKIRYDDHEKMKSVESINPAKRRFNVIISDPYSVCTMKLKIRNNDTVRHIGTNCESTR